MLECIFSTPFIKGIYEWENGKAVLDTSKHSNDVGTMDFAAIQINEAVRVFKEGLATSTEDIDNAYKYRWAGLIRSA